MVQETFAHHAREVLSQDHTVLGLAVGGSWLSKELDDYSDLDLILVTRDRISDSKERMLAYASRLGSLLSGFTGEHVGEPRVLICLYDQPLLHVDIKFLTLEEFEDRVEDPHILLEREGCLQQVIRQTTARYPSLDHQWIEDRFWIWVHYALLKIGRGELLEAVDFLGYLRMTVLGPLLHVKNGQQPRGVRKVEFVFPKTDKDQLLATLATHDAQSLLHALQHAIDLYTSLRLALYDDSTLLQSATEAKVMMYLDQVQRELSGT